MAPAYREFRASELLADVHPEAARHEEVEAFLSDTFPFVIFQSSP